MFKAKAASKLKAKRANKRGGRASEARARRQNQGGARRKLAERGDAAQLTEEERAAVKRQLAPDLQRQAKADEEDGRSSARIGRARAEADDGESTDEDGSSAARSSDSRYARPASGTSRQRTRSSWRYDGPEDSSQGKAVRQ
eukprot:2493332-Pyramimonas_sp.AAC.1